MVDTLKDYVFELEDLRVVHRFPPRVEGIKDLNLVRIWGETLLEGTKNRKGLHHITARGQSGFAVGGEILGSPFILNDGLCEVQFRFRKAKFKVFDMSSPTIARETLVRSLHPSAVTRVSGLVVTVISYREVPLNE